MARCRLDLLFDDDSVTSLQDLPRPFGCTMNKCMMLVAFLASKHALSRNAAAAWMATAAGKRQRSFHRLLPLCQSSTHMDDQGRQIRRRSNDDDNEWDKDYMDNRASDDDWNVAPSRTNFQDYSTSRRRFDNDRDQDGWDDFDPFRNNNNDDDRRDNNRNFNNRGYNRSPGSIGGRRSRQRSDSGDTRRFNNHRKNGPARSRNSNNFSRQYDNRYSSPPAKNESPDRKINMRALEGAGFVHLYGLASTLNALEANRRDFRRPEDEIDLDSLEGNDLRYELKQRERKPEAQFSPWLFLQSSTGEKSTRSYSKSMQADRVQYLAEKRGIPIAHVDKGVLNSLSNNRPHQGYVLRCGKLDFDLLPRLPNPNGEDEDEDEEAGDNFSGEEFSLHPPKLWLALDEVVDPQNLGALLRSVHFLGGDGSSETSPAVRVLVCAKNSAPPSPVVSASSAGALEIMKIYSTYNLHKTLATAEMDGYRVIGASSSVPKNLDDVPIYNLQDLPPLDPNQPTVLVLGSEGHGIRNLVATSCTEFVRIPGGSEHMNQDADVGGVDSLNVSVTGGILLWHLLRG